MILSQPAEFRSLLEAMLRVLPDDLLEKVGRDELEEFAVALGRDGAPVVLTTARDAAQMMGLFGHPVLRAALSPRGAARAAELEALGRSCPQDDTRSADVGSARSAATAAASRSNGDSINVKQAAALLGLKPRRVRDLAAGLGGRQDASGIWRLDRAVVEAFARKRGALTRGDGDGEATG